MASLTPARAEIAVIGGSGLYDLLENPSVVPVATPYADAPVQVALGHFAGRDIAFLARHGGGHAIPPQQINFRANLWALARLGVTAIFASAAVGSLNPELRPDTFAVPDQIIDRTRGRQDTYFDGTVGGVQHLTFADPFCPEIRAALVAALDGMGESFAATATTVVIPGPRFSTRAESLALRQLGGDLVNMTQYPESALAAELGIGYASLAFVTDMDAGVPGGAGEDEAVTVDAVIARLFAARGRMVAAIEAGIRALPADYAPRQLVSGDAVGQVLTQPVVSAVASEHSVSHEESVPHVPGVPEQGGSPAPQEGDSK